MDSSSQSTRRSLSIRRVALPSPCRCLLKRVCGVRYFRRFGASCSPPAPFEVCAERRDPHVLSVFDFGNATLGDAKAFRKVHLGNPCVGAKLEQPVLCECFLTKFVLAFFRSRSRHYLVLENVEAPGHA